MSKVLDLTVATLPAVQAAEAKLLLHTYERNPVLFVGGEGVHLIDEQGNRYLDLLSGYGVFAMRSTAWSACRISRPVGPYTGSELA